MGREDKKGLERRECELLGSYGSADLIWNLENCPGMVENKDFHKTFVPSDLRKKLD